MNNQRTTLVLLALVLVLGSYWLMTGPDRERDDRNILALHPAQSIESDRIREISIEMDGEIYLLKKTNQLWRLAQPVDAPANESAVARLIAAVQEARWSQQITAKDQSSSGVGPVDYGLSPPRASITLSTDKQSATFRLGKLSSDGREIYLQRNNLHSILVTSRDVEAALPTDLIDLRDRRLIPITPDRVRRIEWLTRDGPLEVARSPDEHWRLTRPVAAAAHDAAIRQWLDRLYEFRIQDFIAESMAAGSLYGFDDPLRQLTLTGDTGSAPLVLKVGQAVDAAETAYYATFSGQEQVFSIDRAAAEWLAPTMREFRDNRLSTLTANDIVGIDMTDDERTLQLRINTQQVWEVTAPKPMGASPGKVTAFLEAWLSSTVEDFIDPPISDMSLYGLHTTSRVLRLMRALPETGGGLTLIIGRTNENNNFYAKLAGPESVVELPVRLLDNFHVTSMAFRDPLMLALPEADIIRITQTIAGLSYAVENVDGLFRPVDAGMAPDTDAIRDVIFRVAKLKADELIAEDPSDLSIYGLEPAYARVTFGMATGTLQRVILLGHTREDGSRYATQQGSDIVFTFSTETANALLKPVANSIAPVIPTSTSGATE